MRIWGMIQNQSWLRISHRQVNCLNCTGTLCVRGCARRRGPRGYPHLFKVQLCHPSRKLPRIGGCKTKTNQNDLGLNRNQVCLDIFSCVSVHFKLLIFEDLEVMPAKATGVGEGLVLHLDMLAL